LRIPDAYREEEGGGETRGPGKTWKEDEEKTPEGKEEKKFWTISRFVRVILAQGPC